MYLKSFSDRSVVRNYVCVNWKQINTCVVPRNDAFGYNLKSKSTSASLGSDDFANDFDEIGNREMVSEAGTETNYSANALNQYSEVGDFLPAYDADGNATLIKTATGTWSVSYNAENRPIRFECAGTQTVVEMNYDYLGRRFEKKITVAGTTTLHHRYIYRGFLQIACLDLTRAGTPALWFVFWDPTQPTGTRPLAIQKNGSWFVYGHDLTKNVCEVFGSDGYIKTTYSYSPFGNVSSIGNFEQNSQWSSEFYDPELDLVYYNYRHYSPTTARWLSRDPIEEQGGLNLYCFVKNNPVFFDDIYGMLSISGPLVGYSWSVPTPIAGVFFRVTLSVDVEGFECCKKCKKKKMLSFSGVLTGEVVAGTAYKGKIKAKNSRGSRCSDRKTGRYVKCPNEGWGDGSIIIGDFISDSETCPEPGIDFNASINGSVSAGAFFGGISASFDFPIYPKVEVPELSFGYTQGIAGFEMTIGVSGSLVAVIADGETLNLLI